MKSILIAANSKEKSQKYIEKIREKYGISRFEVSKIVGESSIGIGEARRIKETIFLTPGKGNKKIVVIENADLLTIEAQNALLKTLEEPPDSAFIVLLAESLENLLPTVVSRCEVVRIRDERKRLSEEKGQGFEEKLNTVLSADINKKLKLAQDNGKTKETALIFVEQVIKEAETELIKNRETNFAKMILPEGQKIYTLIKTTNVNPRLAIEHFLLKIS
ncbi:hypothetical protein M1615_01695 [Patescibacteria group bacterium]|nr:hypothetical protein [Patescibacteria group bacterium]MCL5010316.1 hypothetical protein [Patescibacteria group bacterium]